MRKKTVLAFGAFDILHPGHLRYLSKAKKLADKLIVVVARDASIELLKHRKPILSQDARVEIINALKVVDKAVLGNKVLKPSDRYNILKKYRPSVIAFGYDQKVNADDIKKWLKKNNMMSTRVVRIKENVNSDIFKSSKLKKRLHQ